MTESATADAQLAADRGRNARRMSGQVSEQGVRDEAARSGFRVEDEEPWRRGGLGLPLSDRGSGLPAAAARRGQNPTNRTRSACASARGATARARPRRGTKAARAPLSL